MSQEFQETKFSSPPGRRPGMLAIGTVLAVLGAGIAWQVTRAKAGVGPEERQPGSARISGGREMARVNNQVISYDAVAQECMDRYGEGVLNDLINRTIIQQACAEKGVQITQQEVLSEITQISKRFGLDTPTWYKMLEAERGLTAVQYQRSVIWPMIALRKLAGRNVQITNDMLREAYIDSYGAKSKCRMIMLDNHRRAEEVWKDCKRNPEDFARLAQQHSQEPNSRSLGGIVPPIRRYTGAHEAVRKAAFSMRTIGEISPIIHVGLNSYVILKFEGYTEKVEHDKNDVRARLEDQLREQETQRLSAETFKSLRDSARIQNHLTGESTSTLTPVSATGRPAGNGSARSAGFNQPAGGRPGQPRR